MAQAAAAGRIPAMACVVLDESAAGCTKAWVNGTEVLLCLNASFIISHIVLQRQSPRKIVNLLLNISNSICKLTVLWGDDLLRPFNQFIVWCWT